MGWFKWRSYRRRCAVTATVISKTKEHLIKKTADFSGFFYILEFKTIYYDALSKHQSLVPKINPDLSTKLLCDTKDLLFH